MRSLLLTGFEPFDGYRVNPSEAVARRLDGRTIGDWHVTSVILPLDYSRALQVVEEAIVKTQPEVVLCCGQAERGAITIERIAINAISTSRRDNAGNVPEHDVIDPAGPAAYFTGIDPHPLVHRLQAEGIPAFVSYHAGVYGCNWLIYNVLRWIDLGRLNTRATFIHIPPLPEQAIEKSNPSLPTMPLDTLVRALEIVILALS